MRRSRFFPAIRTTETEIQRRNVNGTAFIIQPVFRMLSLTVGVIYTGTLVSIQTGRVDTLFFLGNGCRKRNFPVTRYAIFFVIIQRSVGVQFRTKTRPLPSRPS